MEYVNRLQAQIMPLERKINHMKVLKTGKRVAREQQIILDELNQHMETFK